MVEMMKLRTARAALLVAVASAALPCLAGTAARARGVSKRASGFVGTPVLGPLSRELQCALCRGAHCTPLRDLRMAEASGEDDVVQRQAVRNALQSVYAIEDNNKWEFRKLAIDQALVQAPNSLSIDTGDLTNGDVFCDVGSGNGRLVIAAASMLPATLSLSKGIEIVPALHQSALEAKNRAKGLRTAVCPTDFVLADVHDRLDLLRDVDVCFCYSTAFSASGPYLSQLSATFGLGLCEGARVITVDKMLLSDGPWEYEEIGSIDARNSEVGMSTGYVYRVVKSPNGPR